MYKILNSKYKNTLFKVLSLNGLNIFIRLIVGFLSNKALAFFVGVAGIGVIGLVKSFISFLETILLLGTRNGIVAKLASIDNKEKNNSFVVSLFWLVGCFSIFISLLILFSSSFINEYFFLGKVKNNLVFWACAISIPFQALSLLFNAILNGKSEYKKVSFIAIISNILALLLSILFMWKWNVLGAISVLFIASGLAVLFSGFYFFRIYPIAIFVTPFQFAKKEVLTLADYCLMSLVSAIMSIGFAYYVRMMIISKYSLEYGGYYEAVSTLSAFYMVFINTFMTFYYLPELSKCTTKTEINEVTKQYYKNIIPLFLVGLVFILLSANYLVPFFFNKDFLPIVPYIKYQLLLDLVKAFYLIIGIRFFAFSNSKGFLLCEVFSFATLFLFFTIALYYFEFKGVWYSQIVSACFYLIFLIVYFKKYKYFKK